jgi:hypothetical protein
VAGSSVAVKMEKKNGPSSPWNHSPYRRRRMGPVVADEAVGGGAEHGHQW